MARHRLWMRGVLPVGLIVAAISAWADAARACPFCSATQQTLGEELKSADAAVLAELIKAPPPYDPTKDNGASFRGLDPEMNNATFRIVEKLTGGENLLTTETIEVPYFGPADKDKLFLITGIRTDRLDWTTPLPLSEAAEEYVRKLPALPEQGADRLDFFQEYLEHEDPMLAQDAYDEFARAPYDAVIGLKDRMDHDRIVAWINDVELAPSRRRLYLTMLGVCGQDGDLAMLEYYMSPTEAHFKTAADLSLASGGAAIPSLFRPALYEAAERYERLKKQGLDAMIACYLTLKGADGLPLVEDLFLKDPNGDFKDIFSAIYALRFHGEETDIIPRQRLIESMRLVLDNPTFADQVIADLSRWEDWGVMDRLAKMFKEADENSYVRQPVATYMFIASEQGGDVGKRAEKHLDELRNVDEQAVDDAERNLGFGLFAQARPQSTGSQGASADAATNNLVDASAATAAADPPAERDAPSSTPEAAEVKVALPSGADSTLSTADMALEDPADDPAAEAAGEAAADGDPSRRVAQAGPGQIGQPSRPLAAEEPDAVSPPSRLAILGGTAVAVVVLAGLFALLIRGLGNRTA